MIYDDSCDDFLIDEWNYILAEDRRDVGIYWLAFCDDGMCICGGQSVGGPGKMSDHDRLPVVAFGKIKEAYNLVKSFNFVEDGE